MYIESQYLPLPYLILFLIWIVTGALVMGGAIGILIGKVISLLIRPFMWREK